MKRSVRFAESVGSARCTLPDGRTLTLPIVPGILKHPTLDELASLLTKSAVAKKYTVLALRKAPWQVLREFPRDWLMDCLPEADLSAGRSRALRFLMS